MPSPWQLERLEESESEVFGSGASSGGVVKPPFTGAGDLKKQPKAVTLALVEVVAKEKKKHKKKNKPHSSHGSEVKATTGDCDADESWNGRIVLNTVDNTYKIFVDGAWREIITWV